MLAEAVQGPYFKGTLLGTPNREPQEYSRYIIGIYLPRSLYSIIFLLYSCCSLFGVPSRVPLYLARRCLPSTQPKTQNHKPSWVHVGIWYTLRAQRGSHIPTLRPKYIPYTYMDPLGTLMEPRNSHGGQQKGGWIQGLNGAC